MRAGYTIIQLYYIYNYLSILHDFMIREALLHDAQTVHDNEQTAHLQVRLVFLIRNNLFTDEK